MKILVTGAGGFLGSHLTEKLAINNENQIRCLVRQKNKVERLNAVMKKQSTNLVEIIEGNLTNKDDALSALKDIDIVYHCAAALKGAIADMFYNTVIASRNLLEGIIRANVKRVVLVSSFGVYGFAALPRMAVVDERTLLEQHPTKRDAYSYVKYKQEMLFWSYFKKYGLPLVVIRPGVIYGEGASEFSPRVGLKLFRYFLHLGNGNLLPLTYISNCAEAIVLAGEVPGIEGQVFNVVDDGLITSKEYLRMYKKNVRKIRSLSIPYFLLNLVSRMNEKYFAYSHGQLPDIFTVYKTRSTWKGQRFDNTKVKKVLNWIPYVTTEDGLKRFFFYLRNNNVI